MINTWCYTMMPACMVAGKVCVWCAVCLFFSLHPPSLPVPAVCPVLMPFSQNDLHLVCVCEFPSLFVEPAEGCQRHAPPWQQSISLARTPNGPVCSIFWIFQNTTVTNF